MDEPKRQRRPVVGAGAEDREHVGQGTHRDRITAAEIAHALEARRIGPGTFVVHCVNPAHEDRTPSMSIAEGERGPLVYCHGCHDSEAIIAELRERGLWAKPTVRARRARRRRDQADQLWREALRHLTHGEPLRCPPYTRSLPRSGEVWILCGPNAWSAAQSLQKHNRHALVWPYAEQGVIPCTAYRWPVAGRSVRVFDTANDLAPDPAWAAAVHDFGHLLVARWRALRVEVYGDFEPALIKPEGVADAAA